MSSDAFNPKLLLSSLFLTGYLACMTPGFATEAPQTPTEQEAALLLAADAEANKRFNEAWQAYRKGRIATLENLGATLEAHPLGDYPKLWQLLLEFRRNEDDPDTNLRFIKFIERHQGQYLGEQSASDYLMTAADRINPVLFNRLYSLLQWNQEEPDILAWHHWYNFETTPRKTIEAFVRDSKVKGRPLRMLTDRLMEQNPSWAWSAVLIQLQNRRWQEVRYVVEHAPDKTMPASAKTLTAILNNPQRWYKKNAKNFDKLPARVQIFFIMRMRGIDFKMSQKLAEKLSPKLSSEWQSFLWGQLAYEAAVSQTGDGAALFSRAGNRVYKNPVVVQPDLMAGWAARAYMRDGDWKNVEKAISRMSADARENETWTYWLARAHAEQGRPAKAKPLYEAISKNRTFYGKLACDELGKPYAVETSSAAITEEEIRRWTSDPSIRRAIAFYQNNFYFLGHAEWNWALRNQKPRELYAAATFAKQQGLFHRMINTGQKASKDFFEPELLYPTPHKELITSMSARHGLPDAWVYGLIRQESRFMSGVSSGVGAQGLMQVMPKTAKWLIRKLDLKELKGKPLVDPNTNVALGTAYLNMLREDFDGSFALSSAAYNAGPVRARIWRKTLEKPMEGAVFIESIPYFETRDYVKNVLSNTFMYAHRLKEDLGSFKSFVGTVTPSDPTAKEADLP